MSRNSLLVTVLGIWLQFSNNNVVLAIILRRPHWRILTETSQQFVDKNILWGLV